VKQKPPRSRLGRIFMMVAGAALALNGLQYLALLAAGTPARAHIEYAVSASGARNPVWRVHYEFDAGGTTYKDMATLGAGGRPSGSLRVRYLPFWPGISYYDSAGLLAAYGLLSFLPGAALLYAAIRRGPV
jgi:hypothetical protein